MQPHRRIVFAQFTVVFAILALVLASAGPTVSARAAARPGSTNTGVPSGVALKKYVGNMVITTPGKVIDAYDIHGTIIVKAANVTIKRTLIRGNNTKVAEDLLRASDPAATGLRVYDTTVRPDVPSWYDGIGIRLGARDQVVQRVNVSGTVDGIRIYGSNVKVLDSWLHDFKHYTNDPTQPNGSHDDAIQIQAGTGVRILNNSFSGAYNAGVMVNQDIGTIGDLQINGNYADGGGCTINLTKGRRSYMQGLQVNNNRFGRQQRVTGCAVVFKKSEMSLSPTGNVWDDTGKAAGIRAF